MKDQILLEGDPFYIAERIKEIDENYFLVFNKKRGVFELHNSSQRSSTFALTIPYDTLDERAIFLARKTRRENIDKLIEEMDKENELRTKNLVKRAAEQIQEVIE